MSLQRQVPVTHPVGSSAERRFLARMSAYVAAWRIVAATVVLGPGLLLLREHVALRGPATRAQVTRAVVARFAFEAFPRWATTNHVEPCPTSIEALVPYAGHAPIDTWGKGLELRCGGGYRGAYIRSAGPDGRFDTRDDITSND